MKVLLLALLAVQLASGTSPVTRVVELLENLSKQVEKDGAAEEDLYEGFVCWGKSVIEQKTASNAKAASRIDALETYIADLDAGRITLTTEKKDLEKDINELQTDLETAKASRAKQAAEFESAKAEMTAAITAMSSAEDVLGEATKSSKTGVLMAIRSHLNQGMEAVEQQQTNLNYAVQLGEKFLDKADSTFLRRVLTGDVPKVDFKKLNRKATFKMGYKARSFKIQDVLKKMKATFNTNLQEAKTAEAAAIKSYTGLSKAKQDQLDSAQDALTKSEVENGARGASKQDSQEEVDALKKQVAADEKFIADTTSSLATKKEEWKARQTLRSGELAAIAKTISILRDDAARDLFKKSYASQEGLFLLQEGQHSSSAAHLLRATAAKSGDRRLLSLARLASSGVKDKFKPVIEAIDKMVAVLEAEGAEDEKVKEECESGRMKDTKSALEAGRDIDDLTDTMTKLSEEAAQIAKEIASLKEEKAAAEADLTKAAKQRAKETAEFKVSAKEDEDAAAVVNNAKDVLVNFYKDNGLSLLQKDVAPVVKAGKAPPDAPETFSGEYGGKTKESGGIIAMLEMVHDDIIKDGQAAKAEEGEAQAKFEKFKAETEAEIQDLDTEISNKDGLKGSKEAEHVSTKTERAAKKKSLDAVMKKMEDINGHCEYFTENYKLRKDNRIKELDGLVKAKTLLQGGKFTKEKDPNRELKPGDAFLQRKA